MFVSVVVRSFNRLPNLVQLIERVLADPYEPKEIVVIDQSTEPAPPAVAARLAELKQHTAVRFLQFSPLGGARARNEGWQAARGELCLFIDDDDLPAVPNWIAAHVAVYAAHPTCVGVTGRQRFAGDHDPYGWYTFAGLRCMRFAWLTKMPWTFGQRTDPAAPVDYVHGTNGSIRREVIARLGGWDIDAPVEDESSFGYKARAGLRAGEHFRFDPSPVVQRGLDVAGGLDKRFMPMDKFVARYVRFIRVIVRRYFPWRVRLLAPFYVWWLLVHTWAWIWDDSQTVRSTRQRLRASLAALWVVPRTYFSGDMPARFFPIGFV